MDQSVTASGGMATLWHTTWLRALVLGMAFFALGRLAGQFSFSPHSGSVLWLPGGLSLAFLLRSPTRSWPALLLAVFLAEFSSALVHGLGVPLWVAACWGVGNCLRTLLGAWLMRRFVGTSIQLTRRWEIAGLILFGGLISPLPSATLGTLTGMLWSGAPALSATEWVSWWLSDALGTVLVAPLLLTWSPGLLRPKRAHNLLELGALLVLTALVTTFLFDCHEPQGLRASLPYASFPFILWAALRLGPLGAASTSAMLATVAIWHTRAGKGPFGALAVAPYEQVLTVQLFLAILSLSALTLAAVSCERKRSESLQHLLAEAGTVLAASLDIRVTFPRVARLLVPRAFHGCALWLVAQNGLLERVAQAGWTPEREARLRGRLPPLPSRSLRWCTPEGTVVLAPLRLQGAVQGALVLMNDERVWGPGTDEVSLVEDLAHRCTMALENARLFTEVQQAVEARNEFIAVAAHELRTPLTALTLRMRSLETLLQRERASEVAKEKVRTTSQQLARMSQLIERLLDVGRITTGRWELHREPVDVSELVELVVESFHEEAARRGSSLRVEAETGLTAWWDRGRIEQALTNLLANALKFGAGHPIDVQLTHGEDWVRITVQDHGIGIAPEALERIFERFERAVSSREYGGLGLGLFLARQIAESHGGEIHVQSQPGEGAAFILELPLGPRPARREEEPRPAHQA
ncbi:MASE1 domain-containing protein [Hyalangium rubrum]|uniref:histidine kinase n=1 Tax=Hyalangium rubrum TaxID=3103134 RepID=A0ABU5H2C8_9BACT|nr:MASE1 domain-containing protein [Hyalangium sp. s54d21]MDY7227471.1 MASE1 domain-containing protein [Hyalangium sp. s54d21]